MNLSSLDKTLIAETWTSRELYANLETLCEFGSRFAGTPSEIQARDFIAEKFRAYGLSNVHLDPFEYLGWWRGTCALNVVAPQPRSVHFRVEITDLNQQTIARAVDFTRHARRRGVEVFFVTNREAELEPATRRNLEQAGFPLNPQLDTVLTKGEKPEWTSDKSVRRRDVAARYRILLLCGDDLGDFLGGIAVPPAERQALSARYSANWGTRWIILPNAHYGSWEDALYGFDRSLADHVILERKYEALTRD